MELTGCAPATYAPLLEILAQMGCSVECGPETAVISRFGALHGVGKEFTGVYPALGTDARTYGDVVGSIVGCKRDWDGMEE